jgi:hypothetical protein
MTGRSSAANPFRRILSQLLAPLAVLLMLAEEYLWAGLKALMARLGRLAPVARVEARIAALSPFGAAVAFVIPGLLMLPFKLAALGLMAKGHAVPGVLVLLAAKLTGTALFARLYALCKPALMSVEWFVRLHDGITAAKAWAHARLEGWALYRLMRRLVRRLRNHVSGVLAMWRQPPI